MSSMHGATARSGKYVLRTLSIPTKIPEKKVFNSQKMSIIVR
jgi:hypothetical protein